MTHATISRFITIPHASRLLGVSEKTIRAAVARGELSAIRLAKNGWPRVTEDGIREWLAAGRRRSTSDPGEAAAS